MGDADKACRTPVCARRAEAGFHLCGQCRQVVSRELLSLPGLHRDCGEQLAWAGPDGEAVRVRADVVDILASWCSLVVSERGVVGPAARVVEDLAVFLDVNLAWLAGHDAAADFAIEVGELVEAARRVVHGDVGPGAGREVNRDMDQDAGRQPEPVACGHDGCDRAVRVDGTRRYCEAGHEWEHSEWLSLSTRVRGRAPADRTVHDRTGHDRTGHDRTGQDRMAHDRTGHDRAVRGRRARGRRSGRRT